MRCPYCSAEVKDDVVYCPKCGRRIEASTQGGGPGLADGGETERDNPPAPKRLLGKSIIFGSLLGILAGAAISGGLIMKRNADVESRREQLLTMIDGAGDFDGWTGKAKSRFKAYGLNDEEKERYEELLSKGESLEPDDYLNQMAFVESMRSLEGGVKLRLNAEAEKLFTDLKAQDPGYASDEQKEQLASYASRMEQLISEEKYGKLESLAEEWREYAKTAAQKKTGYQVAVTQYDFSRYPTIRLYLDIRDPEMGGVVNELAPNMFYVSERDAGTGDFLNRAVTKAVQMNENERLNINLLADTSASMTGSSMDSAKAIMRDFISTVQFSAGDQLKLTQFNSIIDKSGYFTGDSSTLNQTINSYVPDGNTKLYDAIIYGVQDVSGQEGARCVIAFTDGMDVGSYHSPQEVVDIVSRYKIPVFIVRIGDSSNSAEDDALRQIAAASGGSFKNLSEFSSDMYAFYGQIYRQLKQYYVVEYEADGTREITQNDDISVYVQRQDKGGEATLSVNPGNELFDTLLGSYLRSYIYDMNHHSYNMLSQYVDSSLDPNDKWSIQWQMKKQVTGGFSNVTEESLMNYSIEGITVQDENTVLLKANENYDVVYDEVYGDLKKSERDVAKDALSFLQTHYGYTDLDDAANIRIWAKVNQIPQYIIKKDASGAWKFSKYAGDLALGEKRQVYDVEVTWQP